MSAHSVTHKAVPLTTDVYTLALERTAYILDHHDRVGVSFSGGKDSTAVLNVALEVIGSDPARYARHLPLRVIHLDEEAIPYQTEEYVRRVSQRDDVALEWYCLPFQHRNACSRTSPYWWPWAPEARERWCRPLPPEAITTLDGFPVWPPQARMTIPDTNGLFAPPQLGNMALLMGIRAQESLVRRSAVTRRKIDNYIVGYTGATSRGNLWKAYPVYDWTTEDVWTAPAIKGWDYNRAYDLQEMAGLTAYQQRCSPAFGEEPIQRLSMFAECFPEVWARMVDRVPGVGAALRYSRTELYGFGGRPEKPAGMSWPDFCLRYAARHGPATGPLVVAKLKDVIRRHYRKTTHPIAEQANHPETGICWDYLLMLAMRGDLKNRRQSHMRLDLVDGVATPRSWHRYAAEVARVTGEGRFGELGHPGPPPADPMALLPAYARQEAL